MAYFPWLIGIAVVVLFWWHAIGARSRARRAALRACAHAEVTFIDELAFKRLWIGRDGDGHFCLKRRYGFEFYRSGERRYGAYIQMNGLRVARLQLDAHPF